MSDVIFFKSQEDFSNRLEEYNTKNSEVWVGYFKKSI